jgi:tRNA (guanine-N7-)-methyltransferase
MPIARLVGIHPFQNKPFENKYFVNITRTDRIRSFVLRAGRTTTGQQRAIDELGPQFLIPFQEHALDLQQAFSGSSRPKILEIGFGMGETTAKIAAFRTEEDFLAIEVHPPGVGALLKLIGENNLTNLRLIRHDAVEVLEKMLSPNSLNGIHIYFADPWHKKRHRKRRLIQAEFARLLTSKLKPSAYLHLNEMFNCYALSVWFFTKEKDAVNVNNYDNNNN